MENLTQEEYKEAKVITDYMTDLKIKFCTEWTQKLDACYNTTQTYANITVACIRKYNQVWNEWQKQHPLAKVDGFNSIIKKLLLEKEECPDVLKRALNYL